MKTQTVLAVLLIQLISGVASWNRIVRKATFQVSVQRKPAEGEMQHEAVGGAVAPAWIVTVADIFSPLRESTRLDRYFVLGGTTAIVIQTADEEKSLKERGLIKTIEKVHILGESNSRIGERNVHRMALLKLTRRFDSNDVQKINLLGYNRNLGDRNVVVYRWAMIRNIFFCFGSTELNLVRNDYTVRKDRNHRLYVSMSQRENTKGALVIYDDRLAGIVTSDKEHEPPRVLKIRKVIDLIEDRVPEVARATTLARLRNVQESSFQAIVYRKLHGKGTAPMCMAIIVHLSWALTQSNIFNETDVKEFEVVAGNTASIVKESSQQKRDCSKLYMHARYIQFKAENDKRFHLYDFALVQLKEPFAETANVKPIDIIWDRKSDIDGKYTSSYYWETRKSYEDTIYLRLATRKFKIETGPFTADENLTELYTTIPKESLSDNDFCALSLTYNDQLIGIMSYKRDQGREHRIAFAEMQTVKETLRPLVERGEITENLHEITFTSNAKSADVQQKKSVKWASTPETGEPSST